MMSEFTPGPWKHSTIANIGNLILGPTGRNSYAGDDGYRNLATVQPCGQFPDHDSEEANQRANIALIAAAPTMYVALRAMLVYYHSAQISAEKEQDLVRGMEAALSAADGQDAEAKP